MNRISFLAAFAIAAFACGGAASNDSARPSSTIPTRASVEHRLESRLASDPNHTLCDRITALVSSGDSGALRPLFDFPAFVERIVARGNLPADVVAQLRANPSGPTNFGRYFQPSNSQSRCLGTRPMHGEPHIAIRQWTPTRWDYVLFHVTTNAEHPIDDYQVVSAGYYHSEGQSASFDPQLRAPMEVVGRMLQQSYDNDFPGIITAYRSLPQTLQDSPIAFFHFVNAVFTSEPTGSPLYTDTAARIETVWRGRDYAIAYWQRIDGHRRGDTAMEERARDRLVELLDDYELLAP